MKKTTSLFLAFLLASAICSAQQGPNVPKNYSLKKAEDYQPYSNNVIDCIKWMRSNHPDFKPEERKNAQAFVLEWINGSPTVSVSLGTKYFMEASEDKKFLYGADLSVMFMFGKTLYIMEHSDDKNDAHAEYAAVKDMITLYNIIIKKNPDMKSKMIEKYIKLEKEGKLEEAVKKECEKTYKK